MNSTTHPCHLSSTAQNRMHMHVLHKVEATYPRHCLETNRKPMANKIQTRVNGELATRSEKLSTSNEINRLFSAGGAITFQVQKKIQKNAEFCSPDVETVGSISEILLDEEFRQPIRSCISHSREFFK